MRGNWRARLAVTERFCAVGPARFGKQCSESSRRGVPCLCEGRRLKAPARGKCRPWLCSETPAQEVALPTWSLGLGFSSQGRIRSYGVRKAEALRARREKSSLKRGSWFRSETLRARKLAVRFLVKETLQPPCGKPTPRKAGRFKPRNAGFQVRSKLRAPRPHRNSVPKLVKGKLALGSRGVPADAI